MSTEERKITLRSSDGQVFEVEETVAMESHTIKHIIEDDCADSCIPVANVTGNILAKVIEYCKKHAASGESDEQLKAWDSEFIKDVSQTTLFALVMAADYLDIKSLLGLTTQTVADMIKDKTPEQVRRIFNIKNDFTPEEEDQVRRENQWTFE